MSLLTDCWDQFSGAEETKMRPDKLSRMEQPTWSPPFIEFSVERHGQIVLDSTRATVQTWSLDIQNLTASIGGEKRRQLYPMDSRLNVVPIAESLAKAIIDKKPDERLKVMEDGRIRLDIKKIIPLTNKETTANRRRRLRRHLESLIEPHGWKRAGSNVYRFGSDARK